MSNTLFTIGGFKISATQIWIALAVLAIYLWSNKKPKSAFVYQGQWDLQQVQQTGCETAGNRPEVLMGYPGAYRTTGCALNF